MYAQHLSEKTIDINHLHLDPNNPRFWSETRGRRTPDMRIADERVQMKTMSEIRKFGVQELRDSILRNGFLPLDRIVVRELEDAADQFVVVEGNRRLAALKSLRQEIEDGTVAEADLDDVYLDAIKKSTDNLDVLVYRGVDARDISWALQGIRHISGIRDWEPAQRARLVASKVDEDHLGFKEAGQMFGLSARAVGRLYRGFKALEQMREDEDYGNKTENEYFSLFDEAIKNNHVKVWLGWDDLERKFTRQDALKQFYSWIVPNEEDERERRRLDDPKEIKKLGDLLSGGHQTLLDAIDAHELDIDEAHRRAVGLEDSPDWQSRLDQATRLIGDIPQRHISDSPAEFLHALENVQNAVDKIRKMAAAVQD